MTDSPSYPEVADLGRANRAFHDALRKYPDAFEALHYFWNEGIAGVAQAPRHPALDWKMQQPECPRCKGNGRIGVMACNDCGATGYTLSSTDRGGAA